MNNTLTQSLKQLRLSGLAQSLSVRLAEAISHQLTHEEFLELILQDELQVRRQRLQHRRNKAARFRDLKTLEDFDFSFNTSIPRPLIYQLATGQFIEQAQDVLMVGPPGIGKSHLIQAIGRAVIGCGYTVLYRSVFDLVRELAIEQNQTESQRLLNRYLKTDLLVIDDMGMKHLPNQAGEYLFEIIMRRYETRSTMMTSNRPIEQWGKLIGDAPSATAILDRFLHHAQIIQITGRSYRLKDRAKSPTNINANPGKKREENK